MPGFALVRMQKFKEHLLVFDKMHILCVCVINKKTIDNNCSYKKTVSYTSTKFELVFPKSSRSIRKGKILSKVIIIMKKIIKFIYNKHNSFCSDDFSIKIKLNNQRRINQRLLSSLQYIKIIDFY